MGEGGVNTPTGSTQFFITGYMRSVSHIAKHESNVPGIELLYHILFTQNEYSAMEKTPYAVMPTAQYIMGAGIKI